MQENLETTALFSEVLLWNELKRKKLRGYDFHRQKPIDKYIVDFFCNELMLAIEIDGTSHINKYKEDIIRQKKLENLGIHFLRFDDLIVKHDISIVLKEIENWIDDYEKGKLIIGKK